MYCLLATSMGEKSRVPFGILGFAAIAALVLRLQISYFLAEIWLWFLKLIIVGENAKSIKAFYI